MDQLQFSKFPTKKYKKKKVNSGMYLLALNFENLQYFHALQKFGTEIGNIAVHLSNPKYSK